MRKKLCCFSEKKKLSKKCLTINTKQVKLKEIETNGCNFSHDYSILWAFIKTGDLNVCASLRFYIGVGRCKTKIKIKFMEIHYVGESDDETPTWAHYLLLRSKMSGKLNAESEMIYPKPEQMRRNRKSSELLWRKNRNNFC